MHMLSVGATGEERGKVVFFGLISSLIGLAGAAIGFFFTHTFYPRDYFPRSLFQEDSSPYDDSDFGSSGFGSSGFGSEGTGSDGFDLLFGVAGLIFVAIGVVWVVFSLGLILRTVRAAAWLDGTRAHVRGGIRAHSVDLATAYVSQGAITTRIGRRVISTPTLEARDPATGKKVTIRLEGIGSGRLPPNELRALADAMSRGRGSSDDDRDVLTLAERLRAGAVKDAP